MDKKKHKYNTRSVSGQQDDNNNQENEENMNFIPTASNIQNENNTTMNIEEEIKVPLVPVHASKKRAVRESFEEETEINISNVVKPGSSVSFVAEPKYKEITDGVEDDDLYIEEEFVTVKNKKNKNDRVKKVFVEKPKNISPKIWRKETGIKLFKVSVEAEKIKGKSPFAKILMVKNLLFQNQIEVILGKIETTNKIKNIVIYLLNEEEVQKAKKVNLGNTENHIYMQDVVEQLPNEYDKLCKWKIWDIPLYVKRNDLMLHLNHFGKVKQLHLTTKDMWQLGHVEFENVEVAEKLSTEWSIWIGMDCLRITSGDTSYEELNNRGKWAAKLTQLPRGMTALDIKQIVKDIKGRTIYIPRTREGYKRKNYAIISFDTEEEMQKHQHSTMKLTEEITIRMVPMITPLCFICSSDLHKAKECNVNKYRKQLVFNKKEKIKQFGNLYKKYKPNYYSNLIKTTPNQNTYADIVKKKANNVEKDINKNKIEEQHEEFDEFNQNVIETMDLYTAQIEELRGGMEEVAKVLTDIAKRLSAIENHNMSKGLADLANTVKGLGTRVHGISGRLDRIQSGNQDRHYPKTNWGAPRWVSIPFQQLFAQIGQKEMGGDMTISCF
ncbi:27377_t:CDS:2, partial [Dentiscutata erythropus]